jgi:hypothetical protein
MSDMQISENNEIKKTLELEQRAKSGANWFYWIAGLSMVNSIILMAGANVNFCIGLGMTQLVDGLAFDAGVEAQTIGRVMNVMVIAAFVYLGVTARKNQPWAFITGLVVYAADGLLFLLVGDWLSMAFHAWGFIGILSGLKAVNQIRESRPPMPVQVTSTPQVGSFQR